VAVARLFVVVAINVRLDHRRDLPALVVSAARSIGRGLVRSHRNRIGRSSRSVVVPSRHILLLKSKRAITLVSGDGPFSVAWLLLGRPHHPLAVGRRPTPRISRLLRSRPRVNTALVVAVDIDVSNVNTPKPVRVAAGLMERDI
jgi:hypothetical protein